PLAAAVVAANMTVAIRKAHWKVGIYGQGGYEFALSLGLAAVAVGLTGPGAISVDGLLGKGRG
ncbi:MAG: DoxX family protein, partial [Candidatus Dormiibacterota bacterium]